MHINNFLNNDMNLKYLSNKKNYIIEVYDTKNESLLIKEKYFLEKYTKKYSYELVYNQNNPYLVLKDFNKILKPLEKLPFTNEKIFFRIFINILLEVKNLHKNSILHGNINKKSIYLDEDLNVYLFNFSNALDFSKENISIPSIYFKNLPLFEKSPEQLGRINKEVDLRSDIYNLGILFYELLTNKHPFFSNDELESFNLILNGELEYNKNIPSKFFNVILKASNKEVKNRYQSIDGFLNDVKVLSENILSEHILAQKDISSKLQFPQNIYGRDDELISLKKHFYQVINKKIKVVFISGYSGVGKSTLIEELKNKLTQNHYFILSKFDQYNKDLPYHAFSQAFEVLVKQILVLDKNSYESLQKELQNEFFENGKILTKLSPTLEKIIGKQKDLVPLPAQENENRFKETIFKFLSIIAKKERSLLFFIDDFQWMDDATLKLIENLIENKNLKNILLICAYRNNEIKNKVLVKEIINKNKKNILDLKPLSKDSLEIFLQETLFLDKKELKTLLDEVYLKTSANPFFFKEFIKKLYEEKLIVFDFKYTKWLFDIDKIKAKNISDNVAHFMLAELTKIDNKTLELLQVASCLGVSFDLILLSKIEELSLSKIIKILKSAFNKGFILPLFNDIYNYNELINANNIEIKFSHDQVQQAFYSSIKESQLELIHFKIGNRLLENKKINYFETLGHLNFAKNFFKEKKQKIQLINLNIKASLEAKEATAFSAALEYNTISMDLLENIKESSLMNLYFEVYLENIELLFLNNKFKEGEEKKLEFYNLNLKNNNELLIKLKKILVVQYTRFGKLDLAINEALEALNTMGHKIKKNISPDNVQEEIIDIKNLLEEKPFLYLSSQKNIKDKEILNILSILTEMQPAAYNSGSILFPITILRLLKLTIIHGNSDLSYYIFTMYALMNTKVLKDYDTSFEALNAAIKIKEKTPRTILTGRFNMMASNFILPWQDKIEESKELREQAYKECLEFGDYYWGIHSYIFGFYADLLICEDLEELKNKTKQIAKLSKDINQISQYYLCNININLINILQGNIQGKTDLEKEALAEFSKQNYMCGKYGLIISKLMEGFFTEKYKEALEVSLNKNLDESSLDEGIFHEAFYKIFNILSILLLQIKEEKIDEEKLLIYKKYIKENISLIKIWKEKSPKYFLGIYYLIKALKKQKKAKYFKVNSFFEKAIFYTRKNNSSLFKGIIYELYGDFKKENKEYKLSNLYYLDAKSEFEKIKAYLKIKNINKKVNKKLLEKEKNESLDLNIIIKSLNIITKEIKLESLIEKILNILLKFSGANKGFIFLNEEKIELAAKMKIDKFSYLLNKKHKEKYPISTINYVLRVKESLFINNTSNTYFEDEYLNLNKPKSLMLIPLIKDSKIKALIYLENDELENIFVKEQVKLIELLSSQILISIENSYLYDELENIVSKRTQDLKNTLSLFDGGQALLFKWENTFPWYVSYVSNNVLSILGYEKEEFEKDKLLFIDLVHPDDKGKVQDEVFKAIKFKDKIIEHKSYRLLHKNGDYLWFYDSTKIVYDKNNNLEYFLGYLVDITKEKKREKHLVQQSKMVALGEMISNIGHQWRQPLNLISTSIGGIKLKNELNILEEKDINEANDLIVSTVKDLSNTIDGFKNFLEHKDTSFEEIKIDELVNKTFSMINHILIDRNIKLITNINKNLYFKSSKNHLVQILLAVLYNSKESLCEKNIDDKYIYLNISKKLNNLEITIHDNGGGIEDKYLNRIFEPYFTTKHQSQGTGLGLYLIHKIITEELKGFISIENERISLKSKKEYMGAKVVITLSNT